MRTNKAIARLELAVMVTLISVFSILFYPFILPGLVAGLVTQPRHEKWVAPLVTLLVVVGWRLGFGEWILRVGGDAVGEWPVELPSGLLNWGLGTFLVAAAIRMPRYFMEGLKGGMSGAGKECIR